MGGAAKFVFRFAILLDGEAVGREAGEREEEQLQEYLKRRSDRSGASGQVSTAVVLFLLCVFLHELVCCGLVRDGLFWATAVCCQCVHEASHTR